MGRSKWVARDATKRRKMSMGDTEKSAYLVASCSLGGEVALRYVKLAGPVAEKAGLEPHCP